MRIVLQIERNANSALRPIPRYSTSAHPAFCGVFGDSSVNALSHLGHNKPVAFRIFLAHNGITSRMELLIWAETPHEDSAVAFHDQFEGGINAELHRNAELTSTPSIQEKVFSGFKERNSGFILPALTDQINRVFIKGVALFEVLKPA